MHTARSAPHVQCLRIPVHSVVVTPFSNSSRTSAFPGACPVHACVRACVSICACACRVCVTHERPCCGAGVRCIQPASPEGPMTGVSTATSRTVSVCAEGCTSSAELHGGWRVGRGSAGLSCELQRADTSVSHWRHGACVLKTESCRPSKAEPVFVLLNRARSLHRGACRRHHDGASVALIRKSRGLDDPENTAAAL